MKEKRAKARKVQTEIHRFSFLPCLFVFEMRKENGLSCGKVQIILQHQYQYYPSGFECAGKAKMIWSVPRN